MTTYTLNNMGVPIDGVKQGPLLQPKSKYRFRVTFLNFGSIGNTAAPITLSIVSTTKPKVNTAEIEVHSYNSVNYYAGKTTFDPIEMVIRDDVTDSVLQNVSSQLQLQFDHYNQTGYRSATNYKFTTLIEVLDGGNTAVLEQWTGEGCFLTKADWGDVNYSENESQTISLSIRADNWTVTDFSGNELFVAPSSDPMGSTL